MNKESELIIVGAGIAGVAASVYARRSGLDFCLFEAKAVGGQLLFMENIDNYVGLGEGLKGRDLAKKLEDTLSSLNIPVCNEEICRVEVQEGNIDLSTRDSSCRAKSVIFATGAAFRRLGLKGEEDFLGKGVSYCAVCDGFFFKGKDVAVVGGGNTAVEEALYLCEVANKVTLIHRRDKLRALDYLKQQLFAKKNIEVLFNHKIKAIKGSGILEEVIIEDTESSQEKSLILQGLFIAVGTKPNTEVVKDIVQCDEKGFIITDEEMRTSFASIWAAGDCRKRPLKQLITASAEGAISAMSVYKYLKGHYLSV